MLQCQVRLNRIWDWVDIMRCTIEAVQVVQNAMLNQRLTSLTLRSFYIPEVVLLVATADHGHG